VSFYACPVCGRRFTREKAADWNFTCTAKGCRGRQGSYDRLGPCDIMLAAPGSGS
jgi:hypothetical protein